MVDLNVTDIVAFIGVVAAVITAIGVFIGPNLAERARRKEEARKAHLANLRTRCIMPVVAGAESLIGQFGASDYMQVIIYRDDEPIPKWSLSVFTTPVSVQAAFRL